MVNRPKINKLLSKINYTASNRKPAQIKYIVKHYVGATGGAEANCKYFQSTYRGASSHYFVGHEGEIWQCVENKNTAWHCGAKAYKHPECRNSNSIGIELCVRKDASGNWYYTEETKRAAAQLCAYLMDKYHIDINHVLRHYDVTGKICGEPDVRSGSNIWSQFQDEVSSILEGDAETPKPVPEVSTPPIVAGNVPYMIRTTCDALNIRSGPGTMYRVKGMIREPDRKKLYTIVEEKNGWGLLKSGAGWIFLKYTRKA